MTELAVSYIGGRWITKTCCCCSAAAEIGGLYRPMKRERERERERGQCVQTRLSGCCVCSESNSN